MQTADPQEASCGAGSRSPGSAWLIVLFLVPFYAIAAVAFGGSTRSSAPPRRSGTRCSGTSRWRRTTSRRGLHRFAPDVFVRTFLYVGWRSRCAS